MERARTARGRGARAAILLAANGADPTLAGIEECLVEQMGALASFVPADLDRAIALYERGADPSQGVVLDGDDEAAVHAARKLAAEASLRLDSGNRRDRTAFVLRVEPFDAEPRDRGRSDRFATTRETVTLDWRDDPRATLEALAILQRALGVSVSVGSGAGPEPSAADAPAGAQSREALIGPARTLSEPGSVRALQPFGLPIAAGVLCETASASATAARTLRPPLIVKVASPDLSRKAASGAIVHGLTSPSEAQRAFARVLRAATAAAPHARLLGAWVAEEHSSPILVDVDIERHRQVGWTLRLAPRTPVAAPLWRLLPLGPSDRASAGDEIVRRTGGTRRAAKELAELLRRLETFVVSLEDLVGAVALRPVGLDGERSACVALDAQVRTSGGEVVSGRRPSGVADAALVEPLRPTKPRGSGPRPTRRPS